jgi:hypothetical protein
VRLLGMPHAHGPDGKKVGDKGKYATLKSRGPHILAGTPMPINSGPAQPSNRPAAHCRS